jgi:predicted RNase H-like HicB family nuclease
MKYRAVIKNEGDWWIGWLLDLPGVNAQERTRDELLASLRIGAEDMLESTTAINGGAQRTTIEVPDPAWAIEA